MTSEAEAKIKAEKQTTHEQISQSATLMAKFGHAFNSKRDPFGDYISNRKPFREAVKEDLKHIPANKLTELQLRFPTDEQVRDEVFADMYAHACDLESNNPRSMLMKELFSNCFKYVQEMPKP